MGAFYQHFLEHVRGTWPWPLHRVPPGFSHDYEEQQCAGVDGPNKSSIWVTSLCICASSGSTKTFLGEGDQGVHDSEDNSLTTQEDEAFSPGHSFLKWRLIWLKISLDLLPVCTKAWWQSSLKAHLQRSAQVGFGGIFLNKTQETDDAVCHTG
jgi:hypothetical protein